MRQAEATEVLDSLILNLGKRFAEIDFESYFTIYTFRNVHQQMIREISDSHLKPTRARISYKFLHMGTNLLAMDVRHHPPKLVFIGGLTAKKEEFIDIIVDNLNSQHLWLLVQAFEAIENHYKNFYGALGYLDKNLWQCEDFGKIRPQDITSKDLLWFQEQVRKTVGRYNIDDILKNLRQVFPNINSILGSAKTHEIDLEFGFKTAAFFRHLIVHSNASVPEKELIPQLEKATGNSFTGNSPWIEHLKYWTYTHFKLQDGIYTLWLIDRTRNYKEIIPTTTRIEQNFDSLLSLLASHACLIYTIAISHFGQVPIWERKTKKQP